MAIHSATETPTPGCPQAAMKGALKGETKPNAISEREQRLGKEWETHLTEGGDIRLSGVAGLFQLLPCADFYLPKSYVEQPLKESYVS